MDKLHDNDGSQPYQRRIGERLPIRVELTWGPVPRGRWGRKPKPWTVPTTDVSLSGFGFESETRSEVRKGQPVLVALGGVSCGALVRVVKPSASPGRTYYGLEFHDEDMLANIKRIIANYEARERAATDDSDDA